MVEIENAINPKKLQFVLKELSKIQVVDKKLLAIIWETSRDYAGDFEMVGRLKIGDQVRTTHFRFRNITNYESWINAMDQDSESEDAIFNGYFYKIDTPKFNLVHGSEYGNGCDFKLEII